MKVCIHVPGGWMSLVTKHEKKILAPLPNGPKMLMDNRTIAPPYKKVNKATLRCQGHPISMPHPPKSAIYPASQT